MSNYKATNIDWKVDEEAAAEYAVNDLASEDFEKIFGAPNAGSLDVEDVKDRIHHEPALAEAIYDLPRELEIPSEVVNAAVEDKARTVIEDYLSDTYGTDVNSFELPKSLEKAIQNGSFEKEIENER